MPRSPRRILRIALAAAAAVLAVAADTRPHPDVAAHPAARAMTPIRARLQPLHPRVSGRSPALSTLCRGARRSEEPECHSTP